MERDTEPDLPKEEARYAIGTARFAEAVVTASVPAVLIQAGTRLSLQRGPLDKLLAALADRSLDIVFGRCTTTIARSEFAYFPIYRDRFVAVCGKNHPLWGRRNVTLKTLAEQDWILPPSDTYAQQMFEQAFLAAGLTPPTATVLSSLGQSDLAMMETQALVALFPESEVLYLQQAGTLRSLGNLNMQYQDVGAVLLRAAAPHPATAAALGALQKFARGLLPPNVMLP